MHLVFDCRSLHRAQGGIGAVSQALVRAMAERKEHRITAILGADPPQYLEIPAVQVDAAMIDEQFEQLGLPGLLIDLGADVYLNPTFSMPALDVGVPSVAIIHDVVFEDHPDWVEAGLRRYLQQWSRFSAKHAAQVVTVSDHARNRIQEVYGVSEERVQRIYNGVGENAFTRPSRQELEGALKRMGINPPFVLSLGSCEPKKGTPELIRAFEQYTRMGMPGTLVLAGAVSGPAFDLAGLIAASGARNRIRQLGYVSEVDKQALLAAAAVLAYPSRYEGFGLPPLEALALGTPCVVSNGTSLPEVVGEAGIQVDVGDAERFAIALGRAVGDAAWRRHILAAGPAQARRFSWNDAASRYWDVCKKARDAHMQAEVA